jgi:hypothetical protein
MRTLGAIVAVAVVVGGVLTVILVDGDSDQPESSGQFEQWLVAADRAEARRLVSNSAELKRILGGSRYVVRSVGEWNAYVARRYRQLLDGGTVVRVTVDPPRTVRAQWAYIGELRPCRRHWVPMTARDLREVSIYVDLSESLVAAIVPSESSGLSDWDVPPRPDSTCA